MSTLQWSLWSEDSFLSIGSNRSVLSIGSIGSACSIGSIGSACSIGSIGSACSIGSIGSACSIGSLLGPVQPVAAFDDVAPVPQPAGPMAGSFAGRTASTFSWGKVRG
jgi:hypothetical protein